MWSLLAPLEHFRIRPSVEAPFWVNSTTSYEVSSIEGKLRSGCPAAISGAWWMNHGEDFRGDFLAAEFRLDKK
jgi:hypothetical protein